MKSFLCNLFNNGIAKTTCWPVGFLGKLGSWSLYGLVSAHGHCINLFSTNMPAGLDSSKGWGRI
jgi:hypothetical protein